jgi:predicted dehydrogenase
MERAAPLRWGILGAGLIAGEFAKDLRFTDAGTAVAIGSRAQETAERFGEEFGVPNRHGSYEALVADPEVEAVYVATPHPFHLDGAILALEAGKPVLVEKPFTMNAAEAREIVRVARERDLFAMEAMWTRFLPHIHEVRRLLAEGVLGELVTLTADHGQWFARDPEHRIFKAELGGGALLDLGVYVVSFASMVLGTPERVVASSEPAFTGVDGQTSMILTHAGGAQAILNTTSLAKTATRAAIVGTEGRIEIEPQFYRPTSFNLIMRGEAPLHHDPAHEGHGLRHQAVEVAHCLREGLRESRLMPLDETVSIMETMDAIRAAVVS